MHPTPRPSALAPGTDVAGYLIDRALSSSPSSTSYAATDRNTGHRVTLHVLAPHLSADPRLRADLRAGTVDPQPIVGSPYIVDRGEYGPDLWIATPAAPTGVLPVVLTAPGSSSTSLARTVAVLGGSFVVAGLTILIVSLVTDGLQDTLTSGIYAREADVESAIRSIAAGVPWFAVELAAVVTLGTGSRRSQGYPPRWTLLTAIIAVAAIRQVIVGSSLLNISKPVDYASQAFICLLTLALGGLAIAACRGPLPGGRLIGPFACLGITYGCYALSAIAYVIHLAIDSRDPFLIFFRVFYNVSSTGVYATIACSIAVLLLQSDSSSALSTAMVSALTVGVIYVVIAELAGEIFYGFSSGTIGVSVIGPVVTMTVAAIAGATLAARRHTIV